MQKVDHGGGGHSSSGGGLSGIGGPNTGVGGRDNSVGGRNNSIGGLNNGVGGQNNGVGGQSNGAGDKNNGSQKNGIGGRNNGGGGSNKNNNPRSSGNRQQQNIVIGKKVAAGLLSWRGADLTMTYYIGYVSNDTSKETLKEGIESQGVSVVDLEEIPRRHNRFRSFKLSIRKKDVNAITDADFWPEGIVVRRYFHRQKRDENSATPPGL